jgi:type I restriction enzyme S subunit
MLETSEKWEVVPLVEVLDFREGPGIMARDFRESGVSLVRLAGLRQRGALLVGCNYLDPEMVSKRWDHFRLKEGDVLLSTSASLGEVAVVDSKGAGAIAYTGIIGFRPKNARILPEFIPFALAAPSFARQIEAMGAGSVLRHFGPLHLRQMTLQIPPVTEQRAIADVLGALDDKIEANQQAIQVEEELATRLVDQAPIQLPLSEFAAVQRTSINPALSGTTLVDHFSLPAFDQGRLPLRQAGVEIKSGKLRIDNVSVLVSRLNPHIPRVWYAVPEPGVLALASTEFVMMTPTNNVSAEEVWACCNTSGFITTLAESVTGTTGSHQRVQASDVLSMEVGDPRSISDVQRTVIQAMVQSAYLLRKESVLLAKIRDTLLPKLLGGSLRINDAETLLENMA